MRRIFSWGHLLYWVAWLALPTALLSALIVAAGVAFGKTRTGEVVVAVVTSQQRADFHVLMIDVDLNYTRLVHLPFSLNDTVISPDGQYVLMLPSQHSHPVRILDLKSGHTHRVSLNDLMLTSSWSPDHSAILFNLNSRSTGEHALYVADFERRTNVRIFSADTASEEVISGTWSPDGLQVVFSAAGTVYVTDARLPVPSALAEGYGPIWSPDGDQIAYLRDGTVHVHDANGSIRRLTDGYGSALLVNWSPDGEWLAFIIPHGERSNRQEIPHTVHVPTGEVYRYDVPAATYVRAMRWSPDSSRLAVVTESLMTATSQAHSAIYIADPTGQSPQLITRNGYNPDWSPDGTRLMYQGWELLGGRSQNWLYITEIPASESIPASAANILYPRWSGDGEMFGYIESVPFSGSAGLYVASKDGSQRKRLTSPDVFVRTFTYWR